MSLLKMVLRPVPGYPDSATSRLPETVHHPCFLKHTVSLSGSVLR
jgi:hypothetical protein